MDKLQWFKFSPSDWMMGKIQRCPEVTQARFMRLCCLYWNNECTLSYDNAEIDLDEEHLDTLIKKKVISSVDGFIHIDFLDVQFAEIEDTSKDKSKSGVIGNLKRWHPEVYKRFSSKEISFEEALTVAKGSHTDRTPIAEGSQIIAEKRRGEEIREEEKRISNTPPVKTGDSKSSLKPKIKSPPQEKEEKKVPQKKEDFDWNNLILHINRNTGRKFKVINNEVRRKFKARLAEGYTKDDIAAAITNAPKTEYHKDNNCQYCTPSFFSRADTIDKYSAVTTDSEKIVAPSMNKK